MSKKADKINIAIDMYVKNIYIEHTPKYSWLQALRDAGYGKGYANSHCSDIWARAKDRIEALKAEIEKKADYDLQWCDQELRDLYDDCRETGDKTNAKGCLDLLIRRKGGLIEVSKDITDVPTYSQEEQQAAKLAADLYVETMSRGKLKAST